MINSKTFKANFKTLGNMDSELQAVLVDQLTFIAYHGLKSGNGTPAKQMADAKIPLWQRQLAKKAERARDNVLAKDADACEAAAREIAEKVVHQAFVKQAETREKAREAREAKKAKDAENAKIAQEAKATRSKKADAAAPGKVDPEERRVLGHYNKKDKDGQPAGKDEVLHLAADEYAAAVAAVKALRAEKRKPRAVASNKAKTADKAAQTDVAATA